MKAVIRETVKGQLSWGQLFSRQLPFCLSTVVIATNESILHYHRVLVKWSPLSKIKCLNEKLERNNEFFDKMFVCSIKLILL